MAAWPQKGPPGRLAFFQLFFLTLWPPSPRTDGKGVYDFAFDNRSIVDRCSSLNHDVNIVHSGYDYKFKSLVIALKRATSHQCFRHPVYIVNSSLLVKSVTVILILLSVSIHWEVFTLAF